MPNTDTPRPLIITSYMADVGQIEKWLAIRPQVYAALSPGESDPLIEMIDTHLELELWTKATEAEFRGFADRADRHRLADAAFAKLLDTPPMTVAGARAIIEYLVAWDDGSVPETGGEYLKTLLRSPIFGLSPPAVHAAAA